MQDRIARIDENLLHRTAGPYIGVKTRRLLCYRNVGFRQLRTFRRLHERTKVRDAKKRRLG